MHRTCKAARPVQSIWAMSFRNDKEYLDRYRKDPNCFGGDLLRGNPKGRRPYGHHQALHITMRSTIARGHRSMLMPSHYKRIKQVLRKQAWNFEIRVYRFANSGNHLHFLIRPPRTRKLFAGFIKALSGLIARIVLAAERGKKRGLRFWDKRPFSRIVPWGRPFQICADYVRKNITEILGATEADSIERKLSGWRTKTPP